MLAHELGHLAHGDTNALLLTNIGNGIFNVITFVGRIITKIIGAIASEVQSLVFLDLACWALGLIINIFLWAIRLAESIILMWNSRRNEYSADRYAVHIGYGGQLTEALTKLLSITTTGKRSIMNLLKSTHPNLSNRIMRLKNMTEVEGNRGRDYVSF